MQTIMKRGISSLVVALAVASTAHAQHSEQLVIDDVAVTSDDANVIAVLDRDVGSFDVTNVFRSFVACSAGDESVIIEAILANPERILDKKTKVEIQQKGYMPIDIIGLTGGPVSGQPAACQGKIQGVDKDKSGTLGDGADQMTARLKCKPSLADELGLDEVQTAELEAVFGAKVSCTVKGVPVQEQP